uniref:AlNc14C31G2860 protein n=1 Tax=Albugo laibachii Nc14 TaxID=890382 RepID=F0W7Q6_9STRA|nr:AlNc14C31G2860 [Albugo laibachii Nc14]|eukprot:CCA17157.1 AlNc14C31G2860 [Albugo laibachii Nc14]
MSDVFARAKEIMKSEAQLLSLVQDRIKERSQSSVAITKRGCGEKTQHGFKSSTAIQWYL